MRFLKVLQTYDELQPYKNVGIAKNTSDINVGGGIAAVRHLFAECAKRSQDR
jgi:hypothetical protein